MRERLMMFPKMSLEEGTKRPTEGILHILGEFLGLKFVGVFSLSNMGTGLKCGTLS